MKVLATCLLLGVVLSGCSAGKVKRDAHTGLFPSGKEYVYRYSASIEAGSEDYVNFASVFNLTGLLHIYQTGDGYNAKLSDLQAGVHNGEFQYYPPTPIALQAYEELNSLEEPFHISVQNGKIVGLTLSGDVPESVRNIQRGLATILQIDLPAVTLTTPASLTVHEHTILGDCETEYEVVPEITNDGIQHTSVRKFRSHEKCDDAPIQSRIPAISFYHTPTPNSRDVLNSSGWANAELELKGNELTLKKLTSGSTLTYFLFGTKGHHQYSFAYTKLELQSVNDGVTVGAPSHPTSFNDLKYVFEQTNNEDEDLTVAQPFYFHTKASDVDASAQSVASEKVIENIEKLVDSLRTTGVYKDLKEFHRTSPLSIIPHIGVLNYDTLKQVYERVKADADGLKKKVFMDTLVITGTGPAVLLVRDIIAASDDLITTIRLCAALPAYIRNPTQKLLKEFEPLLKPTSTNRAEKVTGRIIDLAFAALVKNVCKKNGCQESGLLAKYIKYFSDRFDAATGFEEQTAAVGALRNIAIGGAAEKLLAIATDKHFDDSVRVQAFPGLKYLKLKDPQAVKHALLPIFFDRGEHSEVRSAAAKYAVLYGFEPSVVRQIALYMWTEKCPLVKNYVYTLLQGVGATTRKGLEEKASYARTTLTMFPSWEANPKFSANYLSDYYDPEFNFGHMTDYVVHKVGTTFLPTAVYVNFNGAIAGFNNPYMTFFCRMEGLGKAVTSRIMAATTQITKFDDIKNLFTKIGVVARKETPLKLEFGVMIQNRVVTYHAADQKSLSEIPALIQKLSARASKSYDVDLLRLVMMGGVMTERPSEFGTPVTTLGSATGLWSIKANVNRGKTGDVYNQETDVRVQMHVFGISSLSNHFPALGTVHSVSAHRTMRMRLPRKITLGVDVKNYALNVVANVPKEDDPAVAMFHASATTSVIADLAHRYKANKVEAILAVDNSKPLNVISKGEKFRETRQIGFLHKYLTGVKGGAKYFDCEKVHNRLYVAKQLRKVFGPDNKNTGGRVLSKIRIGLTYLRESLFFSPVTQTCGIKAYFYQDASQPTVFERVEAQIKGKYTADPNKKLGTKVTVKSTMKMVYGGAEPKNRNFDLSANFQTQGMSKRDLKLKVSMKDEITKKNGIVCVDISTVSSKFSDFLSYEGPNEPTTERTINVIYGSEPKDGKEGGCPDPATSPNIKYVRKSHRSQGQIEAATAEVWPYKQCREQKASGKYPGPFTPLTEPCLWAAAEQTKLREANVTIDYKVDPEARNRWRKPGAIIATILLPYWVPEESIAAIDDHAAHHGGHSADGKLIQGKIKLDADFTQGHSVLDIHFHGSQGQSEHYHGIDLDALPFPVIQPQSLRFPPINVKVLQLGIYGYCGVNNQGVQTFDNVTYYADMSECPTLLSADCSATPRYAVYGRKISADKIAITVQLAGQKIEFDNVNSATVDGQQVPLSEEIYTPNDKKIFKIVKVTDDTVLLSSMSLGVHIGYNGYFVSVSAGSRFRATNCGVCGNFNDRKADDFTGPDGTCANLGPQDMMKAYIVRDGNCEGVGSTCPSA